MNKPFTEAELDDLLLAFHSLPMETQMRLAAMSAELRQSTDIDLHAEIDALLLSWATYTDVLLQRAAANIDAWRKEALSSVIDDGDAADEPGSMEVVDVQPRLTPYRKAGQDTRVEGVTETVRAVPNTVTIVLDRAMVERVLAQVPVKE